MIGQTGLRDLQAQYAIGITGTSFSGSVAMVLIFQRYTHSKALVSAPGIAETERSAGYRGRHGPWRFCQTSRASPPPSRTKEKSPVEPLKSRFHNAWPGKAWQGRMQHVRNTRAWTAVALAISRADFSCCCKAHMPSDPQTTQNQVALIGVTAHAPDCRELGLQQFRGNSVFCWLTRGPGARRHGHLDIWWRRGC